MTTAGKMYVCDVKLPFVVNGVKKLEWRERPVSKVEDDRLIRCHFCHGAVRVHRRKVPDGPADHVEHVPGLDVRTCERGSEFQPGDRHKMSENPIE